MGSTIGPVQANFGWRDVSNLLRGRGYTDAQLDGWDDRVSYNLDQSLFWAYIEGGGPAEQSERDVKELDHRKQLADEWLAAKGYDAVYGARPLKRLIQREVGDKLAKALLEGQYGDGSTVTVDVALDGSELVLR